MKKFYLGLVICWTVLAIMNIISFIETHDSDKLLIALLNGVLAFNDFLEYKHIN